MKVMNAEWCAHLVETNLLFRTKIAGLYAYDFKFLVLKAEPNNTSNLNKKLSFQMSHRKWANFVFLLELTLDFKSYQQNPFQAFHN